MSKESTKAAFARETVRIPEPTREGYRGDALKLVTVASVARYTTVAELG
jgi:hypothetical protein